MREPPNTKLGRAANGQGKPAPELTRFQKAATVARVLEPFTIPRLNLPAVMTLLPHYRATAIEGDVIEEMAARKIPLNETTELIWECERAVRYLAEAALDPDEVKAERFSPIGDLADWRGIDQDVIGDCWRMYTDVRTAYDPLATALTLEEILAIEEMIKKKEEPTDLRLRILRLIGVRRLSSYLLTLDGPPSRSASPISTPTESTPPEL